MSKDEKKLVAASYIFNFYQEVQALTNTWANYSNIMLELKSKYKDVKKADDVDKTTINQYTQNVRFAINKCHIMYESIRESAKLEKLAELDDILNRINTDFVVKVEDARQYVLVMNKVVVSQVIQDLLTTSEDLIGQVYTPTPPRA